MLRITAVLLVGLFVSTFAAAADNGIYLGAAVSQSRVDFDINNVSGDGDAFAVGLFEIAIVDIYAKIGLISWDQNIDFANVASIDQSDSGTDAAYGAGVQVHLGSLSLRGEYEKFDIGSSTNAELISIGLTWTFL
jgi:hypothetical protein